MSAASAGLTRTPSGRLAMSEEISVIHPLPVVLFLSVKCPV
jgi:hypothetical protein